MGPGEGWTPRYRSFVGAKLYVDIAELPIADARNALTPPGMQAKLVPQAAAAHVMVAANAEQQQQQQQSGEQQQPPPQ